MSLQIEHISMSYGTTPVLHDISADIKQGEFLSILGHSGCGKTTLLKILAGFVRPTGGTVTMDGTLYSDAHQALAPEKRNMGMVFQSFALWPHMTVRQHVEFPLQCREKSMTPEARRARVDEVLRAVSLEDLADRYPDELSGGQKQRVSLARAIAPSPSLLLMDEPLSALDADLRISMRKEIRRIHRLTGATVIFVTHDQGEALSLSDRIMVLNGGRVEQLGTPEDIYLHPATPFIATFIGRCNFFQGTWEGPIFHAAGNAFTFNGGAIGERFRTENVCPIRPEQIHIGRAQQGLPAIIKERQYNGREIHYLLAHGDQTYTVYAPAGDNFHIGDKVYMAIKNEE